MIQLITKKKQIVKILKLIRLLIFSFKFRKYKINNKKSEDPVIVAACIGILNIH